MERSRVISPNYGCGGYTWWNGIRHRNYGLAATLDATRHVEAHSHIGDDGYTIMDSYNAGFGSWRIAQRAGAQG
jgi:hypothetical protein